MTTQAMDEKVYRLKLKEVYDCVERAFESMDPDDAEVDVAQGSCTILARGKKIILSPQPPVRQIWLAAANLGTAVHFNFDAASSRWMDDKGKGLELFESVEQAVFATLGKRVRIAR